MTSLGESELTTTSMDTMSHLLTASNPSHEDSVSLWLFCLKKRKKEEDHSYGDDPS